MARKQKKPAKLLQTGAIIPTVPDSALGAEVGTVLGKEIKGNMRVHYEKADCPCGGMNERCSKCDGTGYYTKEIVDQFFGTPTNARLNDSTRTGVHSRQESTFSNDQRGDGYGVRERGRYGSNPLYDDHE